MRTRNLLITILLTTFHANIINAQLTGIVEGENKLNINIPTATDNSPVVTRQIGNGIHCSVQIQKAGKLKSMIKDISGITRLNVSGEINTDDVVFMKSITSLQTLDVSRSTIKLFIDESKLKITTSLDTLYIPDVDCHYHLNDPVNSLYWKIKAKYIVKNGLLYINEKKASNVYPGVQGFPNAELNGTPLDISGTLDLTDAVIVNDYFKETAIQRVVFSSKLQKLEGMTFYGCNNLIDLVFANSRNLKIGVIPRSVKRIIIPEGATFDGPYPFREYESQAVILRKNPDLVGTIDVKKPGGLAEMLTYDQAVLIRKLKLTGTLNFADMYAIGKMISLEELDLSEAIVKETADDRVRGAETQAALFEIASAAQYNKDWDREAYKFRSKMAEYGRKAIEEEKGKPSSEVCQLPDKPFVKLPFLKKLYLPASLMKIQSPVLTESKYLEEIWCTKETAALIKFQSEGAEIKYYE